MAKKKSIEEVEAWVCEVTMDADAKLKDLSKLDVDALEAAYADWCADQFVKPVNGLKRFMAML